MNPRIVQMRSNDAILWLFFNYLKNYCAINHCNELIIYSNDDKPLLSAQILDKEIVTEIQKLAPTNKKKEGK